MWLKTFAKSCFYLKPKVDLSKMTLRLIPENDKLLSDLGLVHLFHTDGIAGNGNSFSEKVADGFCGKHSDFGDVKYKFGDVRFIRSARIVRDDFYRNSDRYVILIDLDAQVCGNKVIFTIGLQMVNKEKAIKLASKIAYACEYYSKYSVEENSNFLNY